MINLRIQKTQLIKAKKQLREKLKNDNDDTNNKLRILEDRSRRDNLRVDGIEEWEEKILGRYRENFKRNTKRDIRNPKHKH